MHLMLYIMNEILFLVDANYMKKYLSDQLGVCIVQSQLI